MIFYSGITLFPELELLDARVASALNKIIQYSYFKKKVSLEEMKAHTEDRFLQGRQIAYLIYDYFRVTGVNDSVLDYADLFTAVLRNDSSKEFGTRWEDFLMAMEQFPRDDILESLSEKVKTVLEFYNFKDASRGRLFGFSVPHPRRDTQRRAAAGAQQEDHGKPVRLRQQRG